MHERSGKPRPRPTALAGLARAVALALVGIGCVDSSGGGSPSANQTLRAAAQSTGHLIGAALSASTLGVDPIYTRIAGTEFDDATPETEMTWPALEGAPGQVDFSAADAVVAFAAASGMTVTGHALVSAPALPAWLASLTTADDARAVMTGHIQGLMGHYAGRVRAWNVVDQALTDTSPITYREGVLFDLLGETYIDEAFAIAHAADPTALLFYTESNLEASPDKLAATVALVRRLLGSGVPLSGVGFTLHVSGAAPPNPADLAAALRQITDLGLLVELSALDVRIGTLTSDATTKLDIQRKTYHDIVAICTENPACASITIWGVTDTHSWLDDTSTWVWAGAGPHEPLLFNGDGSKKPAYNGTLAGLLGR